ncbi:MAG: SDR family oxidoreductase [Cellulomonadaceae bacterium]
MSAPPSVHPFSGQTVLVTGVSRRRGIGFAVACAFARAGASVFVHHFAAHDADQPWGGDDLAAVADAIRAELSPGARFGEMAADLRDAPQVEPLIAAAHALTGRLDVLVCNHARSGGDGSILDMSASTLDEFWGANTRSTLLLTRAFALRHTPLSDAAARPGERLGRGRFTRPVGRVFWMTSGQIHGPMRGEVAYASSKAALAGVTPTVAAELLERGIVLNTINPGPVNTGYLDPESTDRPLAELETLVAGMPFGRYGEPTDPARLIMWLASDDGAWVVGQVITSDGGFSLA